MQPRMRPRWSMAVFAEISAPKQRPVGTVVSFALHAGLAVLLVLGIRHAPLMRAVSPGERTGSRITVLYEPQRAPASGYAPESHAAHVAVAPKIPEHAGPSAGQILPQLAAGGSPKPVVTDSPASRNANATTGSDSLGDGNIRIALGAYFPQPKPDLTTLPHGFQGDVVVDVLIDETGKIRQTKLVKGVSPQVDTNVIATVETWRFTPAERDGSPVASYQELLFHYGPV